MGSYMTKEVIPFLQFIEKQSTGLDMFIGYLAQNINTSMSSDRKGLKMPLNKTQILMYSALIPAAIISLAAPACAPKKINPASSTLTEKTQQIQEANLSKGIVDLVKNSIKKLPTKARNTTYGRLSYSRREPPWELASVTDVVADTLYLRGQQETDGFYTADTFDVYSWHGNVFLKVASSQGTNWKREHHTFYDLDIDGVFDKHAHYITDVQTSNDYPLIVLAKSGQPNLRLTNFTDRKDMKDFEIAEADSALRFSLRKGIMAIREYLK